MSRLVTFGCSFTYGHGLKDCIVPPVYPGLNPSNFAWPSQLASQLNLKCVNLSKPGSSNFEILNTILNFEFLQTDVVVVMWSFFERDLLFNEKREHIRIFPTCDNLILKSWAETHCETDLMLRSWFYMHHAYLYLKLQGVEFYFLHVRPEKYFIKLTPTWAKKISLSKINFGKLSSLFPKALDNSHPGQESHDVVSKLIRDEIVQLRNEINHA